MNQTALITGASKRIGRSIAEHLAAKGWNVAIHYNVSSVDAEQLVGRLQHNYPNQLFNAVRANLSIEKEVEGLASSVASSFHEINLLVNNASVFGKGHLKETPVELFDHQFNVNLKAPFLLIRDFANLVKKGNIINLVDTRITNNRSDFAAYTLSKKALWELTKMAALELSPGIRVNAIAPGATLPPEGKDEGYLLKLAENTPMKRPGGIAPVLKCLDFILKNDYLTGQLLFADGGENLGRNV
ncbi:FolM Alternative dihydrofolate reductase 1 [hydrothermal vent metagenome]|uniref:FolM Alternative dihydrofolate reductase 1 n=1 Tax=hydrothermal vent metagenome TaxID=652676 RepID=A0A3B0TG84_9ZZZZ